MNFKEIRLKKAYSSDNDNILEDFYIPALEASFEYNRLAGFFSSTTLAIAAKGILGLIRNGGCLRLIVSPKLTKQDLEVIMSSTEEPQKFIEKKMLTELEFLEDEFIRDHVYALGWLLANNKLEIRVAIPYSETGKILSYENIQLSGLFHQKVGILKDSEGNIITFSGSINETASGWLGNIEEFKVFRSWESSEVEYADADISKFNRFWNNYSDTIKVINIPEAVKNKLISLAKSDIGSIDLTKWYKIKAKKIVLRDNQKEAIEKWIENSMQGILEMATGTGKTFAALGCTYKLMLNKDFPLLVIITVPFSHLSSQWRDDIKEFGIKPDKIIFVDSNNSLWRKELANAIIDLNIGNFSSVFILATHASFSSNDFVSIVRKYKEKVKIMLIADEVHNIGAEQRSIGLIKEYDFKLGLSATPSRWMDEPGTEKIMAYFGKVVFEFPLGKAINTINPDTGKSYLTPFNYLPFFISLNLDELQDYISLSKRIVGLMQSISKNNSDNLESSLEKLLFKRAQLIKDAEGKYSILDNILDKLGKDISHAIIYCSSKQINRVMQILKERDISAHRFTMEEGTAALDKYNGKSERDYILEKFTKGDYKVLVAMKCLDEGIDIPSAKAAVLMCNSTNPREHIQRIGRIIRRDEGKEIADIYDIIVSPSIEKLPKSLKEFEYKIFARELERIHEIGNIAKNHSEVFIKILNIKDKLKKGEA
jgi:superfamily II DNA or RNA helicase